MRLRDFNGALTTDLSSEVTRYFTFMSSWTEVIRLILTRIFKILAKHRLFRYRGLLNASRRVSLLNSFIAFLIGRAPWYRCSVIMCRKTLFFYWMSALNRRYYREKWLIDFDTYSQAYPSSVAAFQALAAWQAVRRKLEKKSVARSGKSTVDPIPSTAIIVFVWLFSINGSHMRSKRRERTSAICEHNIFMSN